MKDSAESNMKAANALRTRNAAPLRKVPRELEEYLGVDDSDPARYRRIVSDFKRRIKFRHGKMSLNDYLELQIAQDGVCAICGKPPDKALTARGRGFHVDHNHETLEVRGLLCYACNHGLGCLGDNAEALEAAKQYVLNPPSKRMEKTFYQTFPRHMEATKGIPSPRQAFVTASKGTPE